MNLSAKKDLIPGGGIRIDKKPLSHYQHKPFPRGVSEVNWGNKFEIEFKPNNPIIGDRVLNVRVGHDFCRCQKVACLAFFEYIPEYGYKQVSYKRGKVSAKYLILGPVDEYMIYASDPEQMEG